MADFFKYNVSTAESVKYDLGLRKYMLAIYNYMAIALAITGFTAFFAANSSGFMHLLYTQGSDGQFRMSMLSWIIAFAPFGFIMALGQVHKMSLQTAKIVFWLFAVTMGLSLSSLFLAYTSQSIARAFFVAASTFGAASIYGYTTKRDMTNFGSFLFMGLIGIVIASLVNMFFASSALEFAVSILSVVIFTGLTAYDTNKLKSMYYVVASESLENGHKVAIRGALSLYLDFINLFISLLRIFGDRRS